MNLDAYEAQVAAACVNPTLPYPANHFAFRHVLATMPEPAGLSMVEIGVGAGGAIPLFTSKGFAFAGIDRDEICVAQSKKSLSEAGQDPSRIIKADLEKRDSLAHLSGAGSFDALIAMGVFPHVDSIRQAMVNAVILIRPGGQIFLEFRNALFSLLTFNRYTREFICNQLLDEASVEVRGAVDAELLSERLNLQIPAGVIHPESFHVPFEIVDIARELGLVNPRIIPFHFHAGMPSIEHKVAQSYRRDSVALEEDASGWKGLFLASAFLLHAQRAE